VNNGGGEGTSCFKIEIRTNTAKLTNVRITRFRQCRDLARESEMFIKDEANIASRVSGIQRGDLYFSKLLSITRKTSTAESPEHKIIRLTGYCPTVYNISIYNSKMVGNRKFKFSVQLPHNTLNSRCHLEVSS